MQPIILFDVDKTLFDSALLGSKTGFIIARECQLSEHEFSKRKEKYIQTLSKNTDFIPNELLRFITGKENNDKLKKKTFDNSQIYLDCVFTDVRPVLKKLQKKYQLGVFSEAEENWQRQKLEMADLTKYFDPEITFISRRKTEPSYLATLPKNAVIIDDKLEVIEDLIAFNAFNPIWINRLKKENQAAAPIITSLDQLEKVLTTTGKHG